METKIKIKKLLSSRSLPADEGTVQAITKLVDAMVKDQCAVAVPETKLGVYLSHNFFDDFPVLERTEPGPVPATIKLLGELLERRKTNA